MSKIIITIKKIVGVAVGLMILEVLLPRALGFIKPYPCFRRLNYISKKLRGYR